MGIILFDAAERRTALLPLTYARPVAGLRCGILTIAEKWARRYGGPVHHHTQDYLQEGYELSLTDDNLLVDGGFLPTVELLSFLPQIAMGEAYTRGGKPVFLRLDREGAGQFLAGNSADRSTKEMPHLPTVSISRPADIFLGNGEAIREDFELVTSGRQSAVPSSTNTIIGPAENLFLEEGVTMEACTLNLTDGPVYIGTAAVVLEGCLIRGPVAVGAGAVLKMGAKIYGSTTLGPSCKVGGEVNNVVMQANSNKGHEGFLGNAVVGEWCNIGADTNASNLKNDYGEVKVWSYASRSAEPTGLQFHGLVLADHAKLAINTMLNTGCVIGYSANVFGAGFPPAFLPSFSWGGAERLTTYRLDRAMATAERMMARRGFSFEDRHRRIFERIFADSAELRGASE